MDFDNSVQRIFNLKYVELLSLLLKWKKSPVVMLTDFAVASTLLNLYSQAVQEYFLNFKKENLVYRESGYTDMLFLNAEK